MQQKEYTKKDYASTSVSKEYAKFVASQYEGGLIFVIRVPSGKGRSIPLEKIIRDDEEFSDWEQEILLARNMRFKVTEIKEGDKYMEVHVKAIGMGRKEVAIAKEKTYKEMLQDFEDLRLRMRERYPEYTDEQIRRMADGVYRMSH